MRDKFRSITSFGLAAATLWLGPYRWPNTNHAQEVPPIIAIVRPGSFAQDFAVQSFMGATPRAAYQHLIAGLVLLGLDLSASYFVVHCAAMIVASYAMMGIAGWLAPTRRVVPVGVAAALAFWVINATSRGWTMQVFPAGSAVPSTFAMAFALLGWWSGTRRKWDVAFVAFAAAAVLQVLVGLLPGLLLVPIALCDYRSRSRRGRQNIWHVAGFLTWVACVAAVVLPSQLGDGHLSSPELVRIFGNVRAPHHWLPSHASAWYWLDQVGMAVGALFLARMMPATAKAGRLRLMATVVVLEVTLLIALNYVGVEVAEIGLIAKLQFQRAIPFALLSIMGIVAWYLVRAFEKRRPLLALGLLVAPVMGLPGASLCIVAASVATGRRLGPTSRAPEIALAAALITLGVWGSAPFDVAGAPRIYLAIAFAAGSLLIVSRPGQRVEGGIAAVSVLLVLMTLLAIGAPQWLKRSSIGRVVARNGPLLIDSSAVTTDVRGLASAIKRVVPEDSVVLLPPLPSLEFIPWLSMRSVVLSWKNIPYTDSGIAEWGKRLDAVLGTRHTGSRSEADLVAEWRNRSDADLGRVAAEFGASYVVSRNEWHPKVGGAVVDTASGWTIWRLDPALRRPPALPARPERR